MTKAQYATWFSDRRTPLIEGGLKPDYGSVRSLDMFGLSEGPLYEEAVRLNREMSDAAASTTR